MIDLITTISLALTLGLSVALTAGFFGTLFYAVFCAPEDVEENDV